MTDSPRQFQIFTQPVWTICRSYEPPGPSEPIHGGHWTFELMHESVQVQVFPPNIYDSTTLICHNICSLPLLVDFLYGRSIANLSHSWKFSHWTQPSEPTVHKEWHYYPRVDIWRDRCVKILSTAWTNWENNAKSLIILSKNWVIIHNQQTIDI